MHNFLSLFRTISLFMLFTINLFAVTEMSGTVVAKKGDLVQVKLLPNDSIVPQVGDKAEFSIDMDGEKVEAGAGKITQVDADTVLVQISDGQPDLQMDTVIHATGEVETNQAKIILGDSGLIDFKDPWQVAEAFWNAMILKDYVKAGTYMLPKYRELFTLEVVEGMKALPPFPEHPRVRVEVDGNKGATIIENWEYYEGPEMLFRNGRWWIGK